MPLPSRSECKSFSDCMSKTYNIEISHGKPHEQARAISLSHCGKLFPGNVKKIRRELKDLREIIEQYKELNEKKKKWMQKATSPDTKGDLKSWCKRNGFNGVCQECINKAAKAGGHAAQMALFAVNTNKGKYHWPKKKKEKK